MRFGGRRTSSNVENRRGAGGGFGLPMGGGGLRVGGGSLGCGGLLIVIVIALLLGVNPLQLLGPADQGQFTAPHAQQDGARSGETALDNETDRFISQVLASTEDQWGRLFQQAGQTYTPTTLVLYDRTDRSGCGIAQAAMGPFYCPSDQRIFIDTVFFNELSQRLGAPGDFAQAYVIAHEVGHHIQTLDGTADQVRRAQARASEAEANALQVRMELQADCYAGVWASTERAALEQGDVQEGMTAAAAIGDDTLQQASQGFVVPESFTHGTSEQRMEWLQRGLTTGDPAACDTFAGRI
ncbi:KPN_02809 family neutral zinc metallopeptidase [Sphingosinicella humi]|uniref:Zinc metalloprotease n=1 Tax=Allosphingosinicella humi TaxID=2068657 RepID=A0A2U2J352_9SPHN|nr:neutral zinc metallopeptidase [Sphingosinicella humi]PWG02776.1 zinc metalloprotease [Sphingosinicella humi]